MAQLLLRTGAELTARADQGFTALHIASGRGRVQVVDLLLSAGADLEVRDSHGYTPLLTAAQRGQVEALQRLLAAGANCMVQGNDGLDPVMLAMKYGHLKAADLLMDTLVSSRHNASFTPRPCCCRALLYMHDNYMNQQLLSNIGASGLQHIHCQIVLRILVQRGGRFCTGSTS